MGVRFSFADVTGAITVRGAMSRMYPIFIDVAGRKVLVVGGGNVAQRKAESLLGAGAKVLLVSPVVTERIEALGTTDTLEIQKRAYCDGDVAGAYLVIAATGDEQVNRAVFAEANRQGVFCNVVDVPELCSFHVPSVVRRGPLQIAISTSGVSPALAKRLRKELEGQFGEYYETFLAGLAELRSYVKQKYPDDPPRRSEVLEQFVNSEALELLRQGDTARFQKMIKDITS